MLQTNYSKRYTCRLSILRVSESDAQSRNSLCQHSNISTQLTTTLVNVYVKKIWHICLEQVPCTYDDSLGQRHVDRSDRPIYYNDNRTTASPPLLGSSHNLTDQVYSPSKSTTKAVKQTTWKDLPTVICQQHIVEFWPLCRVRRAATMEWTRVFSSSQTATLSPTIPLATLDYHG